MKDRIKITIDGHVADVMLDRADKMNAVDGAMFDALAEAADSVSSQSAIRAVVLHGSGGNFCAGIDIQAMASGDVTSDADLDTPLSPSPANRFQRAAYAWRELEIPVIAALQGVVFGAGFQIAMGADIRFAAHDVKMSIMESKWGLIPDMGITATVRGILSPDRVKELAWTGRIVAAEEAQALGLLAALDDDPHAAAMELAHQCAGRSPDAIRGIKRLVNEAWAMSEAEALRLEADLQRAIIGSSNQLEAVQANLAKRAPNFAD